MNKGFINDCIWMSYRYCIGRHTIAAAMHAKDIADYLQKHPELYTGSNKGFYARDIRNEISHIIHMYRNVHVEGHNDNIDALSLLLEHMKKNDIKVFYEYHFEINLYTMEVFSEKLELGMWNSSISWEMDFYDLLIWVRLANWMDQRYEVTIEYNGEVKTIECYKGYGIRNNEIEVNYYSLDKGFNDAYIVPEYIKDIIKIS